MDVSAVSEAITSMAAASQQIQTVMETQVNMMREVAESQQQVAQILAEGGLGQNINVSA